MDYIKEIVKELNNLTGKYGIYEIFSDWTTMLAIAISNSVDARWSEKREKKYLDIANRYTSDELKTIAKLNGYLTIAADKRMFDAMGSIYMNLGVAGKQLGQFFTPYHLCQAMGKMNVPNISNDDGWISVYEPSVGAGGNIIALCEAMKDRGINYQEHCVAVCQDLDWKCVYMAYCQLSMYGIPAIVVQGNTLKEPWTMEKGFTENVFVTPMYVLNAHLFTRSKRIKKIKIKNEQHTV